jgi:aminoglycoside 3-N-acetyltransferase I
LNTVNELQKLISVFTLAFESEYKVSDTYLEKILESTTTLVLGAIDNDEIVGGLVAMEMSPIHGTKEFYIYDIAVHPEHQQKGIGKKLIEHLKMEAKNRGIETIFVEAESEDTGAVEFYRKIGGEEVAVNHFNFNIS